AQLCVRDRVEPAARSVAALVDRVGDAGVFLQVRLEPFRPPQPLILLRRESDNALEHALEMEGALADVAAESRERDRFVEMRIDVAACAIDGRHPGRLRLARFAAQAGAESRVLRFLDRCEERHVLLSRSARWAAGAAVNAGGV